MAYGYAARITDRIGKAEPGSVFVHADFADIASTETVRRTMNRLVSSGTLRRVLRGVYEKPEYSEFLGENVAADPDRVARALARNYHWTIAPCGNAALNMLGLSTQVPVVWSYVSDGPYRTYEWNRTRLVFKHRTNREITGLSPVTALVVRALKALGRENVSEEVLNRLRRRLGEEDKRLALAEAAEAADWVLDAIRKIAE